MTTVLSDEDIGMEGVKPPAQAHKARKRGRWGRNLVLSDPEAPSLSAAAAGRRDVTHAGHAGKETQLF